MRKTCGQVIRKIDEVGDSEVFVCDGLSIVNIIHKRKCRTQGGVQVYHEQSILAASILQITQC